MKCNVKRYFVRVYVPLICECACVCVCVFIDLFKFKTKKKFQFFLVNLLFIFGHTITRFEFDWFRIAASNACFSPFLPLLVVAKIRRIVVKYVWPKMLLEKHKHTHTRLKPNIQKHPKSKSIHTKRRTKKKKEKKTNSLHFSPKTNNNNNKTQINNT